MGLEATGSHDVLVEDAFVPEYRTHRAVDGFMQDSPGNAVNTSPLYRLPFGQIFVRAVSSSAIGALQGAVDHFIAHNKARVAVNDGRKMLQTRPPRAPWPTPWSASMSAAPCCCATSR